MEWRWTFSFQNFWKTSPTNNRNTMCPFTCSVTKTYQPKVSQSSDVNIIRWAKASFQCRSHALRQVARTTEVSQRSSSKMKCSSLSLLLINSWTQVASRPGEDKHFYWWGHKRVSGWEQLDGGFQWAISYEEKNMIGYVELIWINVYWKLTKAKYVFEARQHFTLYWSDS